VNNDLVINATESEIIIALLEDKQLVELHKEKREKKFSVGDIYLGKVKKIMPGLNSAFVDVGYEKDAFLHYQDLGPQFATMHKYVQTAIDNHKNLKKFENLQLLPEINKKGKINEQLSAGQRVLVQITKEPISTKGPRLTSEISIAGRNLVLLPFSDRVNISQKINSKTRIKKTPSCPESVLLLFFTARLLRRYGDCKLFYSFFAHFEYFEYAPGRFCCAPDKAFVRNLPY